MVSTLEDAQNRQYLLGHPVGHSKSAVMYNAVYAAAGIPWHYELLDCPSTDEAQAILKNAAFRSVNITTPYKPLAFAAASLCDAAAICANGANLLVNEGLFLGQGFKYPSDQSCDQTLNQSLAQSSDEVLNRPFLVAYNTDGAGCVGFLEQDGFDFSGSQVVICGSGPTALSILGACLDHGVAQVWLLGRDDVHVRKVIGAWQKRREDTLGRCAPQVQAGSYAQGRKALIHADLVINATPLGMKPQDAAPFDVNLLSSHQRVFDAVYGHGVTALVQAALQLGCKVNDGAGMLVMQAVETLRILTKSAPLSVRERLGAYTTQELFDLMAQAAGFSFNE